MQFSNRTLLTLTKSFSLLNLRINKSLKCLSITLTAHKSSWDAKKTTKTYHNCNIDSQIQKQHILDFLKIKKYFAMHNTLQTYI